MDSDNRSPKDGKPPRPGAGGGDPNFNWRSLILVAIAISLVAAYLVVRNGVAANSHELPYDQFIKALTNNQIIQGRRSSPQPADRGG